MYGSMVKMLSFCSDMRGERGSKVPWKLGWVYVMMSQRVVVWCCVGNEGGCDMAVDGV